MEEAKREVAALDNERILRNMTPGQIFSKVENDLEDAVSRMSNAPTADVASKARECMAEVIKVARSSSNLQGGYVKILKHAAIVGSASTEVLRTRVDNYSGTEHSDDSSQIKALKKELEMMKKAMHQAREEAERAKEETAAIRQELAEIKRRTRGRRKIYRQDSSPSPPSNPGEKKS